ncbi:uncharacterized protein [Procambarus clarkii]|uniref:uncharacterized protein isoform X2 n=1 Tax=Procambarus clarkii TaxID=6728 RepID=UPI003744A58D
MASSNSSQKKPFQRCCPICSNVISVRRHFCNCGHSFIDEKRKGDVEREEKYKEMGRRAAKHQNLCRSFKAMKKSVGNSNTTKGMLPGSGLSSKNVNNLTELFYLAYMQDNGSSVNKIPTNNIDAQEDINISEAKEKNGEQELKLKKMKKKRRLSEDSTIKVHIQENQNRKIREAKDKNVEQEDKSLKKMKKHRLSQDTTVTAHQCLLTAEASTFIRVPKDHILEGSKTSIILKPSNRKEERNNLKIVKKEDESVGKGQVMMVQKKITHYLSDRR